MRGSLLVAALAVAQPTGEPARMAVVFSGPALAGRYSVRVVMSPLDEADHQKVRDAIARELGLADRLFSRENPASEVSRLNAHASSEPLAVSAEAMGALALARRASELTGGAFDVTALPLVEAWGLRPDGRPPAVPPADAVSALRAAVGHRMLGLDVERLTVTKERPEAACDLSALAGGWVSDRVAGAIAALGFPDVLVDLGGEVTARGRRADGRRWHVALEPPGAGPGSPGSLLELEGVAVATSGDHRDAWTDARGRRRSHVLDPRTGEPAVNPLASATVVHRDGAWAGALAAALLVLGPDEGRALAVREHLAARLVERRADGTLAARVTPALEAFLVP